MGLFNFFKKAASSVLPDQGDKRFAALIEAAYEEAKVSNTYYWGIVATDSKVFNEQVATLSDKDKVAFIIDCVQQITKYFTNRTSGMYSSDDKGLNLTYIRTGFSNHLLKTKLDLNEEDIVKLISVFRSNKRYGTGSTLASWPIAYMVGQVERHLKKEKLSTSLLATLKELRDEVRGTGTGFTPKESAKLISRLDKMIFQSEEGESAVLPVWFQPDDEFGIYANGVLTEMGQEQRVHWFRILQLSQKASGGSPSPKYLKDGKDLITGSGTGHFRETINQFILFVTRMKEKTVQHHSRIDGRDYNYTSTVFLSPVNVEMIKGLVWLCVHIENRNTLFTLSVLAERCYRKIPGTGPAAASIGNACLYVLANTDGLEGVAHLSRLKLRIKQSSTQNLIEKYLNQAAEKQAVSVHDIEDMAVDDYGLENGEMTKMFGDYRSVVTIIGVGKTAWNWYKPDGSPQKSVPANVKSDFASELKELKETIKEIEQTTSAQRDRLDRMFRAERELSWEKFNEFYFSHGLMGFLARKLIWTFTTGDKNESAIFMNGEWRNPAGALTKPPEADTVIALWHPVFYPVEEVRAWRGFMISNSIVQPLKQAFREVYLLTDAEINTRTYSNRMAAHILKQHQFNSLAKTRGWKYALLGAYDDGRSNEAASLVLPDHGMRAEFWVNEVNADDAFNDTGIWNFISTDQVRFLRSDTDQLLELIDVPARVFTEVMRDVDLFVGVASVGNDPAWRDNGGLVQYRDYWQNYSFGDLTEVAKTRKSTLERIVPRLKISSVAEVKDKFLVVKGKLRTYKIHIGSTNILMEPNDQYLCIVPDRSAKNETQDLFLPFEGDNGVSVILSKAFLLAEDDKIKDTTITSQINRR